MKIVIGVVIAAAVGGWLAIGLLFASGPQPEIIVPAEVLTKIGPINISNTMITAWTVMAVIIIFSIIATRSIKLLPGGLQNFVEASLEFLLDQVQAIAGEKNGRIFFPVIATFFLFIIVSNWFGLLPFFNAIGQTEDIGHEFWHEIELHHEEGHPFDEEVHHGMWFMEDTGGIGLVKPGAADAEFAIHEGTEPSNALDDYIVFLAEQFTDFEPGEAEGEDHGVTAADVTGALVALEAAKDDGAPIIHLAAAEGDDHAEEGAETPAEEGHHGVPSHALEGTVVTGIEFQDEKLALIIPYFRSVFSDINNTLALAICSFLIVEFWGFQALGLGYLGKFFVNPFTNPIGTFVGLLELISEFIRIISFAFRLFGNIFAGEVLIIMLTFLMPFLFVDVIYGLELFVGFIQAAVFSLLSLVFAVMAVTPHHGDDHDEEHGDGHGEGAGEPAH